MKHLLTLTLLITFAAHGQSLFSNENEVKEWQKRTGPFKSINDFGSNSPGDLDRIEANAKEFLNNPSVDRVKYPNQLLNSQSFEPRKSHINLRDAAFIYLLTNESKYSNAIKTELLAQSREFEFTNQSIFGSVGGGNPYFDIAAWLTRLLYAYDIIQPTLSNSEKSQLQKWFIDAATMYQSKYIDVNFRNIFPNRETGEYTPSNRGKEIRGLTHDGGYQTNTCHRWYHNRASAAVMYYGLVGVVFDNQPLIKSAKRWFKEWVKFGVFPSGLVVEFYRTVDAPTRPEAGYGYSSITVDYMQMLADALSRKGDSELYDYTTSEGYGDSKGGNKSLLLAMQVLSQLPFDEYFDPKTNENAIYSGSTHNTSTKMDGRRDDVYARPLWFVQANRYYKDEILEQSYNRLLNDPMKHNNVAGLEPYSGGLNTLPGKLYMWHGVAIEPLPPDITNELQLLNDKLDSIIILIREPRIFIGTVK